MDDKTLLLKAAQAAGFGLNARMQSQREAEFPERACAVADARDVVEPADRQRVRAGVGCDAGDGHWADAH